MSKELYAIYDSHDFLQITLQTVHPLPRMPPIHTR